MIATIFRSRLNPDPATRGEYARRAATAACRFARFGGTAYFR